MEELLNYEGLVYSVINRYPKRFDREDLYQAGMIGLIDAYRHYDRSRDTKFSSFAYYYVVGEINKQISSSSGIKVSRSLIALKRRFLKTREEMTQKLGRIPSDSEVSLYLGVDEELVQEALCATGEVDQIEEGSLYSYNQPTAEVMDLEDEIHKLSEGDRNLIRARYYGNLTQRETSNLLGISQVQVSRQEAKILKKLREHL